MWNAWEWSAAGAPGAPGNYIKPMIDQAKALGANTIRFFGMFSGRNPALLSGSIASYVQTSQATYLARWKQLLDYCRSIGMYVYPTLAGDSNINSSGVPYTDITKGYFYLPTTAWVIGEIQTMVAFLTQWADIIPAIDLYNEAVPAWRDVVGNGDAVYRAAKSVAPQFKYTWSQNAFYAGPAPAPPTGGAWASGAILDFVDLHLYYNMNAADLDATVAFYNRPVLVGECGENLGAPANRAARYNSLSAVSGNVTAGRRTAGGIVWAMCPQGAGAADYGLCDVAMAPRADVSAIFTAMPS